MRRVRWGARAGQSGFGFDKKVRSAAGSRNPLAELRCLGPPLLRGEPLPWLATAAAPRRAAVNAFGFGGTNFHVVLEEFRDEVKSARKGAQEWPCQLFTWKLEGSRILRGQPGLRDGLQKEERYSLRETSF